MAAAEIVAFCFALVVHALSPFILPSAPVGDETGAGSAAATATAIVASRAAFGTAGRSGCERLGSSSASAPAA
jgi:hypothetical protein